MINPASIKQILSETSSRLDDGSSIFEQGYGHLNLTGLLGAAAGTLTGNTVYVHNVRRRPAKNRRRVFQCVVTAIFPIQTA